MNPGGMADIWNKLFDRTLLRFIMVGVVNTVFGTTVMFVAYNLFHWSYWVSSALNYILGSILSFFLNKYFTFKYRGMEFSTILKFVVNILACYLVAYGMAKPFAKWMFSSLSVTWVENIAMAIGMCVFVGLNYFGQRFYVFRETKQH